MAATLTHVKRTKNLGQIVVLEDVKLDAAYPTGGYAIDPRAVGLTTATFVAVEPKGGYHFEWDRANSKLKVYYADPNAAAKEPLVEVAAGTDLSAVTVRVLFMGD